jgi:hypothetical protein
MRDGILQKQIAYLRVSERPVKPKRSRARMRDEPAAASLVRIGFGEGDELLPDAATLVGWMDGDLAHLHAAIIEGLEHQRGDERFAIEGGEMMPERFIGEIRLTPRKPERRAQDCFTQALGCGVLRSAGFDAAEGDHS